MDDDELFKSAWLKWGRAIVHAQTLMNDVSSAADQLTDVATTATYDPDRHVMVVTATEPFTTPAHWGVLLGDILAGFRSSLDHVAWALACLGDTPPDTLTDKQAKNIQFPIYEKEKAYDDNVGRMLPGVTDARALDIVRAFQPFPGSVTAQAISVLHDRNNRDKHRHVQPTLMYPLGVTWEVTGAHDCTIIDNGSTETAVPFGQGAVLCTIKIAETGPAPSLTVDVAGTFAVALPDGTSLELWIEATAKLVAGLIVRFGFPPDEVGHLLNTFMTRRYTDDPGTPPWLPGFAP